MPDHKRLVADIRLFPDSLTFLLYSYFIPIWQKNHQMELKAYGETGSSGSPRLQVGLENGSERK